MPRLPNQIDASFHRMESNLTSDSADSQLLARTSRQGVISFMAKLDADKGPSSPARGMVLNVESPSKSLYSDDSSNTDSTHCESDEFDASTQVKQIGKSNHKLEEERGFPVEEPLLKENPHRFVLFPIEDNEVRLLWHSFVCLFGGSTEINNTLYFSLRTDLANVQEG